MVSAYQKFYSKNRLAERQRIEKYRSDIRKWFIEYKNGLKCEVCGETASCCLEFHHKNPEEKDFEIGQICNKTVNKEKILGELSKCRVLCCNCHRKEHFNNGEFFFNKSKNNSWKYMKK